MRDATVSVRDEASPYCRRLPGYSVVQFYSRVIGQVV